MYRFQKEQFKLKATLKETWLHLGLVSSLIQICHRHIFQEPEDVEDNYPIPWTSLFAPYTHRFYGSDLSLSRFSSFKGLLYWAAAALEFTVCMCWRQTLCEVKFGFITRVRVLLCLLNENLLKIILPGWAVTLATIQLPSHLTDMANVYLVWMHLGYFMGQMLFSFGALLACAQKNECDENSMGFIMSLGATGLSRCVWAGTRPVLCSITNSTCTPRMWVWGN